MAYLLLSSRLKWHLSTTSSVRAFSHSFQQSKDDPYEILQITRLATHQEVKEAFRKLAQVHHPDMHLQQAKSDKEKAQIHDRFLRIKAAYEQIISDMHGPKK